MPKIVFKSVAEKEAGGECLSLNPVFSIFEKKIDGKFKEIFENLNFVRQKIENNFENQ